MPLLLPSRLPPQRPQLHLPPPPPQLWFERCAVHMSVSLARWEPATLSQQSGSVGLEKMPPATTLSGASEHECPWEVGEKSVQVNSRAEALCISSKALGGPAAGLGLLWCTAAGGPAPRNGRRAKFLDEALN